MKLALNDFGCLVSNDYIIDSFRSYIGKCCVFIVDF
jgi:hypothetical protein